MQQSSRLEVIDTIKGIAITLVVLGHALVAGYMIKGASFSFQQCFDIIYGFHMSVFFVVAGLFVQKWTTLDFKTAFIRKFCRLMIPYFTWGFLFAIYKQLGQQFSTEMVSSEGITTFLSSPWKPWNIFWFVYVLFFINLLYYVVIHWCKNYQTGQKLFLIISIPVYLLGYFQPHGWILYSLCNYMPFFAIGTYLLPLFNKKYPLGWKNGICCFGTFIIVNILYLKLTKTVNTGPLYLYKFVTSVSGCWLIYYVSSWIIQNSKQINALFNFLGKKSLEIYVLHPFIIGIGRVILRKCFGTHFLWGQVILLTFVATTVCAIVWKCIDEKNKFYRIMFGVFKKTSNTPNPTPL